jgi:hypothetical protein
MPVKLTRSQARKHYGTKILACETYQEANKIYVCAVTNLSLTNDDLNELQTMMCQKSHYQKNDKRRTWRG